jgi:hypothetical protein
MVEFWFEKEVGGLKVVLMSFGGSLGAVQWAIALTLLWKIDCMGASVCVSSCVLGCVAGL